MSNYYSFKQYSNIIDSTFKFVYTTQSTSRNYTYGNRERIQWNKTFGGDLPDTAGPKHLWEAVRCSTAAPTYFMPYTYAASRLL